MDKFKREIHLAKKLIKNFQLDLKGLTIITECASNSYLFTPLSVCLAGGKAICVGKDSKYGSFTENKKELVYLMEKNHISSSQYEIHEDEIPIELYSKADIVCNSGFVRKINKKQIDRFKYNTIIPLMWETWEYRKDDIDFETCQQKDIPVIGTNESFHKINMFDYNFYIVLKLMFELKIEINNSKIVLLGGHKTGESIAKRFLDLDIDFEWFKEESSTDSKFKSYGYHQLEKILDFEEVDVILCCEHSSQNELLGKNSDLNFNQIYKKHPNIAFGHVCGNIDFQELKSSNIPYYPKLIKPFGYMSYQAFDLGPRPVIELNIAGLKVGEIATKAKLRSLSSEEAINETIKHGIGQDFKGGFFNFIFEK